MKKILQAGLAVILIQVGMSCEQAIEDNSTNEIKVSTLPSEEIASLEEYLETIPVVEPTRLNEQTALELVALPLSCVDNLHEKPSGREYLYKIDYSFISEYKEKRSFYGCSDWHSAVHSHWMMVKVAKMFPNLSVEKLIREKLNSHLAEENLKGELKFFEENKKFERPYGYAWAMKLYEELYTWDDKEAQKWMSNLKPLIDLFVERTINYVNSRTFPMRNGTHSNTALSMSLMLDFARSTNAEEFEQILINRGIYFFVNDKYCSTWMEPSGSDFISPCLAQAEYMSKILSQDEFLTWFDEFMPELYSDVFQPLTGAVQYEDKERAKEELEGSVSHLDGLALYRGWAMNAIANKLPTLDKRKEILRRLAIKQGEEGLKVLFDTDYTGTHWLGTYAFYYLFTNELFTNEE